MLVGMFGDVLADRLPRFRCNQRNKDRFRENGRYTKRDQEGGKGLVQPNTLSSSSDRLPLMSTASPERSPENNSRSSSTVPAGSPKP